MRMFALIRRIPIGMEIYVFFEWPSKIVAILLNLKHFVFLFSSNLILLFRAVFKFEEDNTLKVTATGSDFDEFKSCFGSNDRGFGYIRIKVRICYFCDICVINRFINTCHRPGMSGAKEPSLSF